MLGSTGADISPAVPSGSGGSNVITILQAAARSNAVTLTTPSGWTPIAGPVDQGTTWRTYWFWRAWQAGDPATVLNDWSATTGDKYGRTWAFQGVDTTSPFAATATSVGTADPGVATGVTTDAANQYVASIGMSADNLATAVTVTATNPASLPQDAYTAIATGNDAGGWLAHGTRATAGATGNVSHDFNGVPLQWAILIAAIREAPTITQKAGSEAVALADSSSLSVFFDRVDSVIWNEPLMGARDFTAEIAGTPAALDNFALAEAAEAGTGPEAKAGSEAFALAEAFGLQGSLSVVDALTLNAETFALNALHDRTDTFGFTESAALAEQALKVASDAHTLATESSTLLEQLLKAANDSTALTDLAALQETRSLNVSETFTLAEAFDALVNLSLTDAASLADLAAVLETRLLNGADNLTVSEAINLLLSFSATDEAATLGELAERLETTLLNATDTAVMSEMLALSLQLARVDALTLATEAAVKLETLNVSGSESHALSEAAVIAANAIAADSWLFSELSTGGEFATKSASDTLTLSEIASITESIFKAVADTISANESLTLSAGIQVAEGFTLQEALAQAAVQLAVAEQHQTSEIASIAAVLAGLDSFNFAAELATLDDEAFVQVLGALVTAAVTIQGMAGVSVDVGGSTTSELDETATGQASAAIDVPGTATATVD